MALERQIRFRPGPAVDQVALLNLEWLVTNGLGGYASGTVPGVNTRRYHGLLVAALPSPFGRMVMLDHLRERVELPDGTFAEICGEERVSEGLKLLCVDWLTEFRLEQGLPVWSYSMGELTLEKRVLLPHGQNTVHITYAMVAGNFPVRLLVDPAVHFRPHESPVDEASKAPYAFTASQGRYELSRGPESPALRFWLESESEAFRLNDQWIDNVAYRTEEARGYPAQGRLYVPGSFMLTVAPDRPATLIASTERWEICQALSAEQATISERQRRERLLAQAAPEIRAGAAAELVLAADQFAVTPAGRVEDTARASARGDGIRTIIAGYHWFTDWGRDTMISLEGVTLVTGRQTEAGFILRTFAQYVKDGLIPNMFPEGEREGIYNTADATLWYFHALNRYLEATQDRATLHNLLPRLVDIIRHHVHGTAFGIGMDPGDGLLREGAPNVQLTWMDAKVEDWVVTPRRGKPVEINALWYNALRLLAGWLAEERGPAAAAPLNELADTAYRSFNRRFWYEEGGHLYDIVDGEGGDDRSCRPNQLLAISLDNPVLDPARWAPVVSVVQQRLLTPVGLRTLAPGSPDYKPVYFGDLRDRDAAYHQGTVWAWLIGPFIDAWLKVHPDMVTEARGLLTGFLPDLDRACIGSISEIYDAEEPFTPRGCVSQAWSVAEVLRSFVRTAGGAGEAGRSGPWTRPGSQEEPSG